MNETVTYEFDAKTGKFVSEVKSAEKATTGFENTAKGSSKNIADSFTSIGTKMTVAGGVILSAIGLATKGFLDLESGVQVFDKVFEDGSKAVDKFYQDNRDSIALTVDEYQNLAGQVGDTLKPFGILGDELDNTTQQALEQAIALSQWKGVDIDTAIDAVSKAMLGEREQLKGLGVALSDAEVTTRALADSGKTSASELTAQDKALATLALTAEKGSDALENFGNLSRLQKLEVAFSKVKEVIYNAIETVIIPALDKVIPYIERFVDFLTLPENQKFVSATLAIVGVLGVLLAVFGPLLIVVGMLIPALGTIAGAIGAIASPVLIVIGVILAIIGLMKLFGISFEDLYNTFKPIIDAIKQAFTETFSQVQSDINEYVLPAIQKFVDTIKEWWVVIEPYFTKFVEILAVIIPIAVKFLYNVIKVQLTLVLTVWKIVFTTVLAIVRGVINAIVTIIRVMVATIKAIVNTIKTIFSTVLNFVKGLFTSFKNFVGSIMSGVKDVIKGIVNGDIKGIFEGLKKILSAPFEFLQSVAQTAIDNVLGFFNNLKDKISGIASGIGDTISKLNPFDSAISVLTSGNNSSLPLLGGGSHATNYNWNVNVTERSVNNAGGLQNLKNRAMVVSV